MKNEHVETLGRAMDQLGGQVRQLFNEHHFITIIGGFFVVLMILGFYRFLRSISPALVAVILFLVLAILILHWTQTRTEPRLLKPVIDWLAPFFPAPVYKG